MFVHNALSGTVVIGCRFANDLLKVYRPVEGRCWYVFSHSISRKLSLVSSKCAKDIRRDGFNRFHLKLPRAGILLAVVVSQRNLVTCETSSCTWVSFPHFNWHIACQAGAAVKLRHIVAIIATYNRSSQTLQVPQKINFFCNCAC